MFQLQLLDFGRVVRFPFDHDTDFPGSVWWEGLDMSTVTDQAALVREAILAAVDAGTEWKLDTQLTADTDCFSSHPNPCAIG